MNRVWNVIFVLVVSSCGVAIAQDAPSMKLHLHEIRDANMGIVSHTVTLPEGWKCEGKLEWSQGELSFPQLRYDLLSPGGGRVRMFPMVVQSYTEMNPVPGFQPMPPQGTPAPRDFPSWMLQTVMHNDSKYREMHLTNSTRDEKIEASLNQIDRNTNANTQGVQREVHVMTYDYLENGSPRREYDIMVYTRLAPIINQNIRSQMWTFYPMCMLSAPVDAFEKELPMLQQAALSVKTTPQWFKASQELIAEMSRQRIANIAAAIAERGRQIDKMTDDDYRKYKESNASSNSAQHDRISSIYETEDFRDSNGSIVNLPIHYKHVFSDGSGNYVLSNNSQDKPGAHWNEIDRMK